MVILLVDRLADEMAAEKAGNLVVPSVVWLAEWRVGTKAEQWADQKEYLKVDLWAGRRVAQLVWRLVDKKALMMVDHLVVQLVSRMVDEKVVAMAVN